MKAIYTFIDDEGAKTHIVVTKIRRVSLAFGSLVIEFDNGDKETFEVEEAPKILNDIIESIEEFYKK